jgi:hypothetical protein
MWNHVHCDGFAFFFVYHLDSVPILVDALNEIGAHRTADICRRAINIAFPNGVPETSDGFLTDPCDWPEEVSDPLDELDREFFKHPDADIAHLLYEFIQNHSEEFENLPERFSPKRE